MLIPFDQLFQRHNIKTNGVLHLGGNSGQEALAYRNQGISRVIWVEALPEIYTKLCQHLEGFPGQTAVCACLSDVDGQPVSFNVASNDGQSSSMLEFGTHSKEHPTVKFVDRVQLVTSRFDTLNLRTPFGISNDWFLNVDLQGAELLAMKGMGELIRKFKYAYIEVNKAELYKGCPMVEEIDLFLAGYGFTRKETKWTGSNWGDAFYSKV